MNVDKGGARKARRNLANTSLAARGEASSPPPTEYWSRDARDERLPLNEAAETGALREV